MKHWAPVVPRVAAESGYLEAHGTDTQVGQFDPHIFAFVADSMSKQILGH